MKTIDLAIEQFAVSAMLADELFQHVNPAQVRAHVEYSLTHMARMLTVSMRLPAQKLPKTLVASYPATWWDHLKARLGWKHNTMKVYREDTVVFPDIGLPEKLTRNVRVVTQYCEPVFSHYPTT